MSKCYCNLLRTTTRKIAAIYDQALAPLGINIAQYSLLRTIGRRQPISMTELGHETQLERSTIGRNVRVLERMGLVTVGRSDADLREAIITLAPQGLEMLERAVPLWDECQKTLEARLGPVKITALQEILHSL